MIYNKLADLLEFPILSREEAVVRHLMSQVLTKEKKFIWKLFIIRYYNIYTLVTDLFMI